MAYQKSKKLSATGIVTSPVWRALSADAARSPSPEAGAQAGAEAGPDGRPASTRRTTRWCCKVGSKGSAVKVLQSALRIVPADGEFGPQTKAKVVAYQKSKKLSATGIVTSSVWRALSADADRPSRASTRRTTRSCSRSAQGVAVKVLQSALKIRPVDGDFGPQTRAKVVAYQKTRKLSATGIVTSAGVARPQRRRRAPASAAASRSRPEPRRPGRAALGRPVALTAAAKVTGRYAAYDKVVLKVGSKGSAVTVLQSALWVNPADGEFGPQTKAAVVAYQKAKKLHRRRRRRLRRCGARSAPTPPARARSRRRRSP